MNDHVWATLAWPIFFQGEPFPSNKPLAGGSVAHLSPQDGKFVQWATWPKTSRLPASSKLGDQRV